MNMKWHLELRRYVPIPRCLDVAVLDPDITQGKIAALANHANHGTYMLYEGEYFRISGLDLCCLRGKAGRYRMRKVKPSTLKLARVFAKLLNTMADQQM